MKTSKLLGAAAVLSFLSLSPLFAQTNRSESVQVQAQLLPSQTLPVQIRSARLQNFDTGSNLDVDLTKIPNVRVSKVWIEIYVSHDGAMRRGEGIPVDLADSAPGRAFPLSLTLDSRTHLVPGDTALVFVSRVQSPTGSLGLSTTKAIPLLKQFEGGLFQGNIFESNHAEITNGSTPFSNLENAPGMQPDYPNCDARLQEAKATCAAGVHSFSCDPSTGKFSFTCN